MKIRGFGGVFLCVLALALFACQAQQKPSEQAAAEKTEKAAEIVAPPQLDIPGLSNETLRVSPGIDKTWPGLKTLGERVQKDIDMLKAFFGSSGFDRMANLLEARHAVVSGINYEMMYGGSTSKFWPSVHSPGATLEIRIVSAFVSNVPGPHLRLPFPEESAVKLAAGKKLYNAVAFVSCEIHVISKTEAGVTLHNDTYFMDLAYRHQWCCVWGDEEECPPPGQAPIGQ